MRRVGAEAARAGRSCALLDVRGEAAFAAGHLDGSGHLPRAELRERRAELPPRDQLVLALADDPLEAAAAAAELDAMGYGAVEWLDVPLASLPGGHAGQAPAVRLWRPARFLEQVLPRLRDVGAGAGLAADLAAGSGREAVFLALDGFEVEAWDRAPEALERALALARRNRVKIRPVIADLERPDPGLGTERYHLVTVFRFLFRPLFPALARALAPGGVLVYETYRMGQERFGRPKSRRFLLGPGELAGAFPTLRTLEYEEPGPAEGPYTARLLAVKPGPGVPP
ncbi:MAG TPA: rhodanese-like domain-containing protein [Candidatus Eisenbacteria bacterium]